MTWPNRPTQTHEASEAEIAFLAKYGHLFEPIPQGYDAVLAQLPSTHSPSSESDHG